ncbi:MAG: hypothetical protein ACHQT8_05555 [Chlamydiales bacterium]
MATRATPLETASARTVGNQFVNFESCKFSANTFISVKNHAQLAGRFVDGRSQMYRGEENARKVIFGVLCPIGIALAASIEAFVRGVFGAGVYIYQCTRPEEENENPNGMWWANISYTGALFSTETIANCAVEIFTTIKYWNGPKFTYDELVPCLRQFNQQTLDEMRLLTPAPAPAPVNEGSKPASAPIMPAAATPGV